MVQTMFSFVGNCQTVLQSSYPILHSQQQCTRIPVAPCPSQHSMLSVSWVLSTGMQQYRCCCDLHFPDDIRCKTSFEMLICHPDIFFVEVPVTVSHPFLKPVCLFSIVGFKCCLYILVNMLHQMWLVFFFKYCIFSQSVICLLSLLIFSFKQQIFFNV